jgi:sugar phosphate isomerase/epimerase
MKTYSERRRAFIKMSLMAFAAQSIPFSAIGSVFPAEKRKFKMSLNPGAIGVRLTQEELLDAPVKFGFEAIIAYPSTIAGWTEPEIRDFTDKMKEKKISWGAAGLPVDFRKDAETFRKGMTELPASGAALQKAGVNRMSTWIMPTHAELTYLKNLKQHAERLKEAAKILGDHQIKLGLEYVGPKTLMASQKFSFVHSMSECAELIDAIGEPNVGYQLDTFHWFCAGEKKEDLLSLHNDQIVTVDLNDARTGFTADEQLDSKRELPVATGVIDTRSFLEALVEIGYDGPVRAEPFNQALNDMENDQALQATYNAMKKAFSLVD